MMGAEAKKERTNVSSKRRRGIFFTAAVFIFVLVSIYAAGFTVHADGTTLRNLESNTLFGKIDIDYETKTQDQNIMECVFIFGDSDLVADYYVNLAAKAYKEGDNESGAVYENTAQKILKFGTLGDSIVYGVQGKASLAGIVMKITKSLAIVLVLVYAGIFLIEMISNDRASVEAWIRLFISLTIGIVFLSMLDTIIKAVSNLGLSAYSSIYENVQTWLESFNKSVTEQISQSDAILDIGEGIEGIIAWAIMLITYISITAGAYALLFELAVRTYFMPFAVASLTVDGVSGRRSAGIRFLLNYAGVYLRIAAFSLIITMYLLMETFARNGLLMSVYDWDFLHILLLLAIRSATYATISSTNQTIRMAFE